MVNVCILSAGDVVSWRIWGRRGMVRRGDHQRGHGRVRDHVSTRSSTGIETPATDGIHWRTASASTCLAGVSTGLTSGITAGAVPLVVCVERIGIQGGNDLMHVLVHQILL
jgi:hypothetical protein